MRQLFISNEDLVLDTSVANSGALTAGQVAFFGDGASLSSAADVFRVAQGVASGETPLVSGLIEKSKIAKVVFKDHAAAAPQVVTISGITAAEGEFVLKVIDRSTGYEPFAMYNAIYKASASDTANDIAVGLKAAADANPNFPVTVTLSTDDLVLTGSKPLLTSGEGIYEGRPKASTFEVALAENLAGATKTLTTPGALGIGEPEDIQYLEKTSQGADGFLYRNSVDQPGRPRFYADPATDYHVLTLLYETNTTPNIAKSNRYVEIMIPIATSVANDALDQAAFNTFFGV